jgi:hypothetical protein
MMIQDRSVPTTRAHHGGRDREERVEPGFDVMVHLLDGGEAAPQMLSAPPKRPRGEMGGAWLEQVTSCL